MKTLTTLCLLLVIPFLGTAQADKDTTTTGDTTDFSEYGFRTFDITPCKCPAVYKPGEKVPDTHPNAEYINDTSLWEWKEGPYPGTEVYGLKPQYKDTLIRNDGSVIEVPIWLKNPGWKKPDPEL